PLGTARQIVDPQLMLCPLTIPSPLAFARLFDSISALRTLLPRPARKFLEKSHALLQRLLKKSAGHFFHYFDEPSKKQSSSRRRSTQVVAEEAVK
ncbi:MAG: hypothetical protein ABI577_05405, partial [bacterium]